MNYTVSLSIILELICIMQIYQYSECTVILLVTPGNQQRFDGEEWLDGEWQRHIWLDGDKWATVDGEKG